MTAGRHRHAPVAPACPCWDCRVVRAADRAFDTNDVVELEDLVLVPDVIIAEGRANGLDTPETWTMRRIDGRTVHVYRIPKAVR